MKKKMKRSRSIKLSDIESLDSSPLRKTMSQPGKPPTLNASTTAATPQMQQPMIRTTGGSPNYMKATTSSEARKERSQTNGTLTRSSSLKLVRTLTKSPSFKPVRSAAKKCSRVALCADMDSQKATCSSTLKDSKFPAYLMLNPGGNEAEGTSVLKVCPYTYCSLNGHHHSPLPPLKCFLKARRRSLKVQKSAKLEALSPRRAKTFGDGTEEIRSQLLIFSDDKPPHKEADSIDSATIPVVKEVDVDFFVEIYAKNTAVGPEATEKHTVEDDESNIGFAGEPNKGDSECFFHGGEEAAAEQENMEQVDGNLLDASPHLETDFEENYGQKNYSYPAEIWMTEDVIEEQKAEDVDAEYPPILFQEEGRTERRDNESHIEEVHASMEEDDSISNASEMEWEEEQFSTSGFDAEVHYLDKSDKESCIRDDCLSDIKKFNLTEEPENIRSDDTEPTAVEEKSEDAEKDSTGAVTASASVEEPIVESTAVDENNQEDGVYETEHGIFEKNPRLRDAEKDCNSSITTEALNGYQEDKSLQAEDKIELLQGQIVYSQSFDEMGNAETNEVQMSREMESDQNMAIIASSIEEKQVANDELSMGIQISDSSQSSSEADQDDTEDNDNHNQITAEDSSSSEQLLGQHILAKDGQNDNQNLLGEYQGGANKFKVQTSNNSEEQIDSSIFQISSARFHTGQVEKMEVEVCNQLDTAETIFAAADGISAGSRSKFLHKGSNSSQVHACAFNNGKWMIKCKKPIMDLEEERKFNPREPNFLPLVPDPEAEKVDLRHQIMDDRKNAEEWMLDYALQQTVTKLAPARKRKVALLVEAFETVLPIPNYETHIRHAPAAFSHTTRPIQACS
ncbi:hypothetical protein GH714_017004 [Hevea brasiliensis]|uniref:Calmodulin-binding domain-containing protein n=1 Tax=Hevea brasiliensis TaxID=3981 RepID=A0A6A6N9W7_HEVBR|nr:hypothetical protein GH714_017004 [Hevea brasiliensis]